MLITIEETTLVPKMGKNGQYYLQSAYAHLVNRDGTPQRYPREIQIFPARDEKGNSIAYPKGDYELLDSSFAVVNEFGKESLKLDFINLKKIK